MTAIIDFGTIKQASQPTVTFTWPLSSGHEPSDLTGFTISATARSLDSGAVTTISGVFAVVDGAARSLTWAMSAADTGTSGTFGITLKATDGTDTIYTLYGSLVVEENPSVTGTQNDPLLSISADEAAWVTAGLATVPTATDLIADAPSDGTQYARQDGAWAAVTGGGAVDVDDLTTDTGSATELLRVNATGDGLEYRTQAETLADIGALPANAGILSKSAAYTLADGDSGKIIECDGTFTITAPDGLDAGFQVALSNIGAGIITVAADTTLQAKGAAYTLANQYGMATLYHRGSNVWLLAGDLT